MGSNLFLGVIYNLIGGFASATNFIPFRQIKRWSWEVYWVIQGFAAWIIAPTVMALLFVPHLGSILSEAWHANPHTTSDSSSSSALSGASAYSPVDWPS